MNTDDSLRNSIKNLRRRVRILLAERYALFGAGAGAIIAAALVLLSSRYDVLASYALWIGIVLLGAAFGAAYGLLMRLTDSAVALAVDKRAQLKERMSTAVAMLAGEHPEGMEQAVISDAQSRAASIRPKEVFPHRFGLPHGAFAVALIALLGVIIIPQLPAFHSKTRQQEIEVMKREGAKLKRIAKDLRKHDQLRPLASKVETLAKKMEMARMNKKQAMLKVQRLTKEIEKKQDQLARQNTGGEKPMKDAHEQMRKAGQELAREMAKKLAEKQNIPMSEAMKKVPSDKRLAELARKDGPLTESERKELEEAIEKYTDQKNGLAIPSELGEALAKLAENKDYQKAAELMKKLSERLGSKNMSKADRESLEKQMEQLAKALKNTDLDKLAQAMRENAEKLSKMSDQELQKLLKEIEKQQKMMAALKKAGAG